MNWQNHIKALPATICTISAFLGILLVAVTAEVCYVGQQSNPRGLIQWILPYSDPCICIQIRPGGFNSYPVPTSEPFIHTDDPVLYLRLGDQDIKESFACKAPVNKGPPSCTEYLGMETGEITDDQITSSSFINDTTKTGGWKNSSPAFARLGGSSFWQPSIFDESPWIQVDLGEVKTISGIITQGYGKLNPHWVITLSIEYLNQSWTTFEYDNGTKMVFVANEDEATEKVIMFPVQIRTQVIRVLPRTCTFSITGNSITNPKCKMRFEIIGCK